MVKHYDSESGEWFDIDPARDVQSQVDEQKYVRSLVTNPGIPEEPDIPESPTAGDILSRSMETARDFVGGLGAKADVAFQRALEPAPNIIKQGVRASLAAPGMLASLFTKAPQVAIEAAQNIAKPETYQPGAKDILTAAAKPAIAEEAQYGPVERLGRNVPDLAAAFSPMAGPVFGVPPLEAAEQSVDEGDMWGAAGNLAMAGMAGVGGVAAAAPFAKGPKFAESEFTLGDRPVGEPVPEHVMDELAQNEAAASRGDWGEGAEARRQEILERYPQLQEQPELSLNELKQAQPIAQAELGGQAFPAQRATSFPSTAPGLSGARLESLVTQLTDEMGKTFKDVAPLPKEDLGLEYAGSKEIKDLEGFSYSGMTWHPKGIGKNLPKNKPGIFINDIQLLAKSASNPKEFAEMLADNAAHEYFQHSGGRLHGEILRDAEGPYFMREGTKVYIPEKATAPGSLGGVERSQLGHPADFGTELQGSVGVNNPAWQGLRERFVNTIESSPELWEDLRNPNAGLETEIRTALDKLGGQAAPEPLPEEIKPTWAEFLKKPENKGKKPKQLKLEFEQYQGPPKPPIEEQLKDLPPEPPSVNLPKSTTWMKPVVHNIMKVDPALGTSVRGYLDMSSQMGGEFTAYYDRYTKGLKPEQKGQIRELLEGAIDPSTVDPKLVESATKIRNLLETTYNIAERVGLDPIHRENYFPHIFEQGKGPKRKFELDPFENEAFSGKEDPNLERSREKGRKDYIKDLDVLRNYFNDTSRRIAEANYFGTKWEKVKALMKDAQYDSYTENYLKKSMRRLTGRETAHTFPEFARKASGVARHAQALSDLAFAAPLQLSQFANTAARGGLARSMRGLTRLIVARARGKGGVGGDAFVKALASGALKPDAMMELVGRGAEGKLSSKNPHVDKILNSMYGVGKADRAMRIHAYTVGEILYNDAKAGNKGAIKLIADLKLPEKYSAAEVGRALSDQTQFRTGPAEQPLWASSDAGKLAYQYLHFAYRQSIFVGELFRDARTGNFKPLATYLALGAPVAGEIVADIRAALRGQPINPKEKDTPWNDKEWEENLQAAFRNRRVTWNHPTMRLLQNYATIGGFGLAGNMWDRLAQRDQSVAKLFGGPVASNIEDLAKKTSQEGAKGAAKWGLEQIPGYGYEIARKVFPPKKKSWRTR